MNKHWSVILACAGLMVAADWAVAQNAGPGRGQPEQRGPAGQPPAKGKAKVHKNHDGHQLVAEKLKRDGKHEVGKLANRTVSVEVKKGKVVNMAAGDLPVKRVKSKSKVVLLENGVVPVAWGGATQLAQADFYYYGYCFDDGFEYTCYWYPASDVDYIDYTWDDYDPYY